MPWRDQKLSWGARRARIPMAPKTAWAPSRDRRRRSLRVARRRFNVFERRGLTKCTEYTQHSLPSPLSAPVSALSRTYRDMASRVRGETTDAGASGWYRHAHTHTHARTHTATLHRSLPPPPPLYLLASWLESAPSAHAKASSSGTLLGLSTAGCEAEAIRTRATCSMALFSGTHGTLHRGSQCVDSRISNASAMYRTTEFCACAHRLRLNSERAARHSCQRLVGVHTACGLLFGCLGAAER